MTVPLILHIEPATDVCSVCLGKGGRLLSIRESEGRNDHSKVITLLIAQCMEEAGFRLQELDAVALSSGPGSYTSLRVGTSTAKGICYALEKPLIIIDTLQALALAAYQEEQDEAALYCPMLDARRMEVYTRLFDSKNNPVTKTSSEVIAGHSYLNYFASEKKIFFCGNGAEKCRQVIVSPLAVFSSITSCSARFMISLASQAYDKRKFADVAYYAPQYLKEPNITVSKKRIL